MTATQGEADRLLPDSYPVELEDGSKVDLRPLKTRELLKLMKIIAKGAAQVIFMLRWSQEMDQDEMVGQILGTLMMAIPEAEDETIDFIQAMLVPPAPSISDKPKDRKKELEEFYLRWDNPEIEDTLTIITAIIEHEKDDLFAMGKRLVAMLQTQQSHKSINQNETPQTSSED